MPRSIVYAGRLNRDQLGPKIYTLPDTVLTFGVSGILRDGALVMYDRQTFSVWTQKGVAIAGMLKGQRLKQIESARISWAEWSTKHPQTWVLKPPKRNKKTEKTPEGIPGQ